jgi:hypothetical protein
MRNLIKYKKSKFIIYFNLNLDETYLLKLYNLGYNKWLYKI